MDMRRVETIRLKTKKMKTAMMKHLTWKIFNLMVKWVFSTYLSMTTRHNTTL